MVAPELFAECGRIGCSGPVAPNGNRNALKHGRYTGEAATHGRGPATSCSRFTLDSSAGVNVGIGGAMENPLVRFEIKNQRSVDLLDLTPNS